MLNTGECVVWLPESELNASESVLSVGYVECRLSEGKKSWQLIKRKKKCEDMRQASQAESSQEPLAYLG